MSDIIVYGKGKTGESLMQMLQRLHIDAEMFDDGDVGGSLRVFSQNSLVILSPGIPPYANGVLQAQKAGAKFIGELEFCFPYCKGKCISVTGTNGKTTSCEMIYAALNYGNKKCRLLGNGGIPFSSQVLDIASDEIVVLESSSFQLNGCTCFAPYVSVFTNLSADHINWHGSYEQYSKAKQNNFVNQTEGYAVFNADDKEVVRLSNKCKCTRLFYSVCDKSANCYYDGNNVVLRFENACFSVDANGFSKFAKHNLSNALATILVCYCVGVDPNKAVRAIQAYKLLPHRLQSLGSICGVEFIDDSKATNVHATLSAMNSFSEDIALILGGSDKGEEFDSIFLSARKNVREIVAVGQTAKKIQECGIKYGFDVKIFDDIRQATIYCFEAMKLRRGVVLLSNACASFDTFSSYAERGDYFQKVVDELRYAKTKN